METTTTAQEALQCVYSVSKRCVIDVFKADGKTLYMNQTLEEVRVRYPDAQQALVDDAIKLIEDSLIDDKPTQITHEQFLEAFETMPPVGYSVKNYSEFFKFEEHLYGSITSIYVSHAGSYFTYHDRFTTTHDNALEKVTEYLKQQNQTH